MRTIRELYYTYLGGIRKNEKLPVVLKGIADMLLPVWWHSWRANRVLEAFKKLPEERRKVLQDRLDYYCSVLPDDCHELPAEYPTLGDNSFRHTDHKWPSPISQVKRRLAGSSMYFFDSVGLSRSFPQYLKWNIEGGDVNREMEVPTLAKSRPVLKGNGASRNVLIPMDKARHFLFFKDPFTWEEKETRVIFRGVIEDKMNRRRFVDMWHGHPLCDLKDTGGMSLYQHLRYRYIMALEGNDVATNLKWVMSSNCIAVMPRPTRETWFMEGRLIPDYHYIEIADDYHDLIDKIQYYEQHPEEAKMIILHAHEWVRQFLDKEAERILPVLVMNKYLNSVNP